MSISHQYSTSISNAQSGQEIDEFIKQFQTELSIYQLPEAFKKIGLIVEKTNDCLIVRAHGITLRSRADHIWNNKGALIGRIQFFQVANDDLENAVCYTIFIDKFGNMGHGEFASNFSSKFTGTDLSEVLETLRRVVIGLLNAIHELVPRVDV